MYKLTVLTCSYTDTMYHIACNLYIYTMVDLEYGLVYDNRHYAIIDSGYVENMGAFMGQSMH